MTTIEDRLEPRHGCQVASTPVLEDAASRALEARAFSQDRARQRRPYDPPACSIIPFPKRGS